MNGLSPGHGYVRKDFIETGPRPVGAPQRAIPSRRHPLSPRERGAGGEVSYPNATVFRATPPFSDVAVIVTSPLPRTSHSSRRSLSTLAAPKANIMPRAALRPCRWPIACFFLPMIGSAPSI